MKKTEIQFNDKLHKYYVGNVELTSVTTLIKRYSNKFDADKMAKYVVKKNNRLGKIGVLSYSEDAVKLYWKLNGERASNLGTSAHLFAQMYQLDKSLQPFTKFDKAVIKAFDKLEEEFEILEQEKIVYSMEYKVAGTIDLVLKHRETGKKWVGDWKTTEDMFKSYNMMLEPFEHLIDNPITKYSLQLDVYAKLLGIDTKNKMIIQLKKNGGFEIYSADDMPNTSLDALNMLKM